MYKLLSQIFVFILSLYIALAPSVAVAVVDIPPQELALLRFARQQEIHATNMRVIREGGQVPGYGGYKGTEVVLSGKQPITVTNAATGAVVAELEADVTKKAFINPTAMRIAKGFAGGVATNLIAMALYHMLDKAVDYVLDPANNRVKFTDPTITYGLYHHDAINGFMPEFNLRTGSAAQVCNTLAHMQGQTEPWFYDKGVVSGVSNRQVDCFISSTKTNYSGNFSVDFIPEQQTATYEQLAAEAKSMAAAGDTTAQGGISEIVNNMVENNEIDNSYFNDADSVDNSNDVINNFITNNYPGASTGVGPNGSTGTNSTTGAKDNGDGTKTVTNTNTTTNNDNSTTTTTTTNTTINNTTNNITNITITQTTAPVDKTAPSTTNETSNPTSSTPATSSPSKTSAPVGTQKDDSKDDSKFELPAFCDWAKPVCDFIDWFKKEPEPDNTDHQIRISDDDKTTVNTNISFGGSCPADVTFNFSVLGRSRQVTFFEWSKWCVILETYVRPIVILLAAYVAVLIVGGVKENG